jgi:hypothetical protein
LDSLKILKLDGTQVSDAGLPRLNALTGLRVLTLVGTQVTDAGCDRLRRFLPECNIVRSR